VPIDAVTGAAHRGSADRTVANNDSPKNRTAAAIRFDL
jgi:hypothetical protein